MGVRTAAPQAARLGPKPAFLTADADALHLGTSARHRRAIDALKAGRDYALPAVTEYLDLMAAELEKAEAKQLNVPRYDYRQLNLRVITGLDQIGTRP